MSPATGHPSEHVKHSQTLKLKLNSGELDRVLNSVKTYIYIYKTLKQIFITRDDESVGRHDKTLTHVHTVSTKREKQH